MKVDAGHRDEYVEGEPRLFDIGGVRVGVVRWGDSFYAIRDRCPHMRAPLCSGFFTLRIRTDREIGEIELDDSTPVVTCPWHAWQFDLRTGKALWNSEVRVRTYPVIEGEDGRLYLEAGK